MNDLKKFMPQIGLGLLVLLDLGMSYPLLEIFTADPLAALPPPPVARPAIQLQQNAGAEAKEKKVGKPPSGLLLWDPFEKKGPDKKAAIVEDTGAEVIELAPIPLDQIVLRGIVTLNGRRHALLTLSLEDRVITQEVRKGSVVEGFPDMVVFDVTPGSVIFARPGYLNTPLPLSGLTSSPGELPNEGRWPSGGSKVKIWTHSGPGWYKMDGTESKGRMELSR